MGGRARLALLAILIPVILLAGFAAVLMWNVANPPAPVVGRVAPPFDVAGLRDAESRLSSADLGARPVVMNVWASWCTTCRQEHPMLMALNRAGVPVFGLNFRDTRGHALAYLERRGDPFTRVGHDPKGLASAAWGVHGTPVTFLVDGQGVVRFKHVGPLYPELVERHLLPLMRRLEAESSSRRQG